MLCLASRMFANSKKFSFCRTCRGDGLSFASVRNDTTTWNKCMGFHQSTQFKSRSMPSNDPARLVHFDWTNPLQQVASRNGILQTICVPQDFYVIPLPDPCMHVCLHSLENAQTRKARVPTGVGFASTFRIWVPLRSVMWGWSVS